MACWVDEKIEASGGGGVGGVGGCRAMVSLRHLACATKRIANIACLAFSEGNRSIDFWLCSLFYLHRRVLVPGEWNVPTLVKEKLTHRRRRGRAGRWGGREGWRGIRREEGKSAGLSCERTANQLQISEAEREIKQVKDGEKKGKEEGAESGERMK